MNPLVFCHVNICNTMSFKNMSSLFLEPKVRIGTKTPISVILKGPISAILKKVDNFCDKIERPKIQLSLS